MQPQNTAPPPAPASPNQFDFILKEEPRAKSPFGLPGLPKWALLIIGGAILIIIIIVVSSLLRAGSSGNTEKLYKLITSADEISRVSSLAITESKSQETKNIASTTQEALASNTQQITAYLQSKIKIEPAKIAAVPNTTTDEQLKTAGLNNNYDQVYLAYLKSSLNDYASQLSEAYKTANAESKPILAGAYSSTQTILSDPQLK